VRDVQAGGEGERFGMGGGRGGVDTWGLKAGEAPDVRGLRGKLRRGGSDTGEGDAEGREDGEDWYAGLRDVEGAWGVGVRHRVRWRKEGGEVMWLLDGSAADLGRKGYEGERMAKGRKGKRGGRDVDGLLEEILRTV